MNYKEKKCQYCRGLFKAYKSTQKVCCLDCAMALARTTREKAERKAWTQKKKELKDKTATVTDWVLKVQKVFNSWVRERDKGGCCISCSRPLLGKYDAGHYWNAHNHYATRFDPRNVWSQCVKCNRDLNGNLLEYGYNLEKKIGSKEMENLRELARSTRHYSIPELQELWEYWKAELKRIQDK